MVVPQSGWFIIKKNIKMEDLRYHHLRNDPYSGNISEICTPMTPPRDLDRWRRPHLDLFLRPESPSPMENAMKAGFALPICLKHGSNDLFSHNHLFLAVEIWRDSWKPSPPTKRWRNIDSLETETLEVSSEQTQPADSCLAWIQVCPLQCVSSDFCQGDGGSEHITKWPKIAPNSWWMFARSPEYCRMCLELHSQHQTQLDTEGPRLRYRLWDWV